MASVSAGFFGRFRWAGLRGRLSEELNQVSFGGTHNLEQATLIQVSQAWGYIADGVPLHVVLHPATMISMNDIYSREFDGDAYFQSLNEFAESGVLLCWTGGLMPEGCPAQIRL